MNRPLRPSPAAAVVVAYITAMMMTATDMQIVNVALPALRRDFSVSLAEVQWVVIAYLVTLAILIPSSGWVGNRLGVKQMFITALVLFTGASAFCGAAHSLGELIAARALQGFGGGLLTPTGMTLLYRTFPPEQRARVARLVLLPILIGPGSAPLIGGAFTQLVSWRWVFLINVPIGVAMIAYAWRYLPQVARPSDRRLDAVGLLLSGLGLSSLLYAVSEGPALGWAALPIILTGGISIALLSGFGWWALRHENPILRLRLLGDRLFRATNLVLSLSSGAFLGSLYLTPILLQTVMHRSPLAAGTAVFPEAIGIGIGSQVLGRVYLRCGPRVLASAGSVALVVYLGMFVFVAPGTSLWFVRALMFFGGVANSGVFMALQTAAFTRIDGHDLGHASAIYTTNRQSSIALNVAILTTIVAGAGAHGLSAFHDAYLASAVIAGVGAVCALSLIHTSDARATMRVRTEHG